MIKSVKRKKIFLAKIKSFRAQTRSWQEVFKTESITCTCYNVKLNLSYCTWFHPLIFLPWFYLSSHDGSGVHVSLNLSTASYFANYQVNSSYCVCQVVNYTKNTKQFYPKKNFFHPHYIFPHYIPNLFINEILLLKKYCL